MSAKILAGVTHALVTTSEKTDFQATGMLAAVDFCYGPGDDSRLCQLQLFVTDEQKHVWQGPLTPLRKGGRTVMLPVFTGDALQTLAAAAQRIWERVRADLGQAKFNRRYRVFTGETKAVEDTVAASAA